MRTAFITGANKGIGYHIAAGLVACGNWHVILGCRNEALGTAAADAMRKLPAPAGTTASRVSLIALDQVVPSSIQAASTAVQTLIGAGSALDTLVLNAAIAYPGQCSVPFGEQARNTFACNYTGTLQFLQHFLPLVKPHGGRVIFVSSRMGLLNTASAELQRLLQDDTLSLERVDQLAAEFVSLAALGDHKTRGWPDSAYGTSKILLNAAIRVLARRLRSDGGSATHAGGGLFVASMCPGWCRTDLGTNEAPRSAEEGADTVIWLATAASEASLGPSGAFFAERHQISYVDGSPVTR